LCISISGKIVINNRIFLIMLKSCWIICGKSWDWLLLQIVKKRQWQLHNKNGIKKQRRKSNVHREIALLDILRFHIKELIWPEMIYIVNVRANNTATIFEDSNLWKAKLEYFITNYAEFCAYTYVFINIKYYDWIILYLMELKGNLQ